MRTVTNGVHLMHAVLVNQQVELRVQSVEHIEKLLGRYDRGHFRKSDDVGEKYSHAVVGLSNHSFAVLESLGNMLWEHLSQTHKFQTTFQNGSFRNIVHLPKKIIGAYSLNLCDPSISQSQLCFDASNQLQVLEVK